MCAADTAAASAFLNDEGMLACMQAAESTIHGMSYV